jgi:hypothetical protein
MLSLNDKQKITSIAKMNDYYKAGDPMNSNEFLSLVREAD